MIRLLGVLTLGIAAAPGWADSLTRLEGAVPPALARATPLGPLARGVRLEHVVVSLGLGDRAGLEAIVGAQQDPHSIWYRRWLDPAEIADRFAPTPVAYARARDWFTGHGLTVVRDGAFRTGFVVAGPAEAVEVAFGTRLGTFRVNGRVRRGPLAAPTLPSALGVRAVLGLDDLPRFRPLVRLADGGTALGPGEFSTAYAVGPLHAAGLTGAGRTIAVVARSNFRDADVSAFAERFVGAPPRVRRRLAGADPGILTDPVEELEVLLDTQWAGALAPGAAVNVVIGSPQGDVVEAIYVAVAERAGDVVSVSFGLCEAFAGPSDAEYFDELFTVANAQGQTVLVASGDNGSRDCAPEVTDRPAVSFLAASPHAVAVGGTSFALASDGSLPGPPAEGAWNDGRGAGGGGRSTLFGLPRFQLLAGLGALGASRALPDLAVAASPTTPGFVVVQGGRDLIVGGTSASAPSLASVLTLVNERLVQRAGTAGLGQLLPVLYRLGSEQARGLRAPVFRDVTTGDIGDFAAGPGFDLATGWGAPLAAPLAEAVEAPGVCTPELPCLVPGAGARRRACTGQWLLERAVFASRGRVPRSRQDCRDGDPQCDVDGIADGRCTLSVALCLNVRDFRTVHPSGPRRGRPVCPPGTVRRVRLRAPRGRDPLAAANRAALEAALGTLPVPTSLADACTASVPVVVPVGHTGRRAGTLSARLTGSRGPATARTVLGCVGAEP